MLNNKTGAKLNKVAIIGLGYVGLPLALLVSKKGYETVGVDLDNDKIKKINNRQDPLEDSYVADEIKSTTLTATSNPAVIADCNIIVICVPTPVKDYQPDLGPLVGASETVAKYMKKKALVIIESTVNPGVCDETIIPLIESISGLKVNKDFYLSHCPERINPGDEKWNVENIPRVIGSSNNAGLLQSVKFYESIIDATIKSMESIKEAEACKVVENSFRDVNIAFVNELAKSFSLLEINVKNVIAGASTKPFGYMAFYPGVGVGGHCIPVDPYYLIEYAKGFGFDHEFLSLARSINNSMPEFTVNQLTSALNDIGMPIKGTRICVLGISYKPNVADDRESPSYKLINLLEKKGARLVVFDPYFPKKSTAKTMADALKNCDVAILASSHREFVDYDYKNQPLKVFVDGKNALDRKNFSKNTIYLGIGAR